MTVSVRSASLAISTVAFDGHTWEAAFEAMSRAGVRHAELAFIEGYVDFDETDFSDRNASRLRKTLATFGLTCRALSGHVDMGSADAVEKIVRRLEFARALGAGILVTNATSRQNEQPFFHNLDRCLRHAEATQVRIALENQGHGQDLLFGQASGGKAIVDRIGSPWLGLNYDACNVHTYSNGAIRLQDDILEAGGSLFQVHLKDVAETGNDWIFCALGEGVVDLDAVVRRLASDVALTLEIPLRLQRKGRGDASRREPLPIEVLSVKVKKSVDHICAILARTHG